MNCEIITIGDEILIGQITDTNSPWIAQQLNNIGISVCQMTSVSDTENTIKTALSQAFEKVDLVIITGGLGPTNDDITKKTLTEYFEDHLELNEAIAHHLKEFFGKMNFAFRENDLLQAHLPSKAYILRNDIGTASGMWFKKNGKIAISLPGVPTEMKHLVSDSVMPKLQTEFDLPFILHKTIITYGMRESDMAIRLTDFEAQLPENIKLAYLPNYRKLRLRLTAKGLYKEQLDTSINKQVHLLASYLTDIVVGYEDFLIEEEIGKWMALNHKTLSTAESFTGGNISHLLTMIPGASKYFKGSIVCYNEEVKINELNVKKETINKYSIVSEEVVREMAIGVRNKFNTDFSIATTGNAGPTLDKTNKSVGEIYIGIAHAHGVEVFNFNLGQPREKVILRGSSKALEEFYKIILKSN